MDVKGWVGYWGEFDQFVSIQDSICVNQVTFVGMIAPVFTLNFSNYKVPGGRLLIIRSWTVCSPWDSFAGVGVNASLASNSISTRGWVEYGPATLTPTRSELLAYMDGPATLTKMSAVVMPNCSPVVRVSGVPFPELSGSGGGIYTSITGELIKDL